MLEITIYDCELKLKSGWITVMSPGNNEEINRMSPPKLALEISVACCFHGGPLDSQCAKGTAGSREQVLKARHVAKTTRRRSILGETKSAAKPPGKGAASW